MENDMMAVKLFFCVLFTVAAVWQDCKTGKIPNKLILAGYFAGGMANITSGDMQYLQMAGSVFAGMFLPIVLFGTVWYIGGIGAGDVKLMSVLGMILGGRNILFCSFVSLVLGGGIGVVTKRKKIHFSIPILLALLVTVVKIRTTI